MSEKHLSTEQFLHFFSGELLSEEKSAFVAHLTDCEECMGAYLDLKETTNLIQAAPEAPADIEKAISVILADDYIKELRDYLSPPMVGAQADAFVESHDEANAGIAADTEISPSDEQTLFSEDYLSEGDLTEDTSISLLDDNNDNIPFC